MTELQKAMLVKIARSEYTSINGAMPENPYDTLTWQDTIIETAQDKGVFTSLLNAGLVYSNGRGQEASCQLTEKGFAQYLAIAN